MYYDRGKNSNFKPNKTFIFTKQYHIILSVNKVINKIITYCLCKVATTTKYNIHVIDEKYKSFYTISRSVTYFIRYLPDYVLFAFLLVYLRYKWLSRFHESWESSPIYV